MIPLQKRSTALRGCRASARRLAAELDRKEVEHGIEADHELGALLLDGLRDAIGERRRCDRARCSRSQGYPGRAGDRLRVERDDPELRRRASQERADEQQLVGVLRCADAAAPPASATSAPASSAAPAPRGRVRDAAIRPPASASARTNPGWTRRDEEARLQRAEPVELGDAVEHLLEGGEPVTQPGSVLEALRPRERAQPLAAAPVAPRRGRRPRARRARGPRPTPSRRLRAPARAASPPSTTDQRAPRRRR